MNRRNGTAGATFPLPRVDRAAKLCWAAIAVDAAGHGHGMCGHQHADADEATRCPWDPPRPYRCDLLVREVRRDAVVRAMAAPRPTWKPTQLEMWRAA